MNNNEQVLTDIKKLLLDFGKRISPALVVIVGFICGFAVLLLSLLGIIANNENLQLPAPSANTVNKANLVMIKTATVRLSNSTADTVTVTAEVADTESKRAQGLMNRSSLDNNSGMLFVYETEQQASFWMKDTLLPLDIVFIDANSNITNVSANTVPNNTSNIYKSNAPVKYVLELNANRAAELNYSAGTKLDIKIVQQ